MGAFNRNDFVLSGNSLGLGAVPNTGTTKLYVGGNVLVSGNIFISGNTVLTGVNLSSYATVSNFSEGEVVPIPTLAPLVILTASASLLVKSCIKPLGFAVASFKALLS